ANLGRFRCRWRSAWWISFWEHCFAPLSRYKPRCERWRDSYTFLWRHSVCDTNNERAAVNEAPSAAPQGTFWERNEFLLRRLHSLSGMVPVGAYMVVHLLTNASVLDSSAAFQRNVYQIHSLGAVLPMVEWTFIFLPLLYHAIY